MPFCSNCGEEYTLGDKFCSVCGSKIGDATAPPVELEEEETIWEGRPSGLTSGITSSTFYILTNQRLRILSGRLSKKEEEIELIRIKDIRVKQGLMDRGKGIGDVEVVSADETTPNLVLKDIKDPVGVKETIRNAVRAERSNKLRYQERLHASSVKTGMHRIGPLEFFMPNSAIKARAHRGLISIDFEFWHNYKVQNEILI